MSNRRTLAGLIVATLLGACSSDRAAKPAARDAAAPPRGAADAGAAAATKATPGEPAPSPAPPVAGDPCAPAAVRAIRNQAQAALSAGRAAEAVRLLEAVSCSVEGDQALERNTEIAWAISDRSYARYKAGDLRGCYVAAESQLLPYSGNVAEVFDDSERVMQALQHNAALCREALEASWGTFAGATCAIDPDSHGIPPDALPPGSKPSCLEIAGGTKDADELWTCGAVTLVSRAGGGKPARQVLKVPDSHLTDGSVCCNITGVGFARAGDALRIRVDGEGRDCNGGTASSTETTIYELKGDTLTVIDTVHAAYH